MTIMERFLWELDEPRRRNRRMVEALERRTVNLRLRNAEARNAELGDKLDKAIDLIREFLDEDDERDEWAMRAVAFLEMRIRRERRRIPPVPRRRWPGRNE